MNNKTIYQVDAFTNKAFKGNPAGVMIVDEQTDSTWMQNIALEMNLSETAFIIPQEKHFKIRYFTPIKEVDLCGHATLASAHILYETGLVNAKDTILFKAKGADLSITKDADWLVMNFPQYRIAPTDIPSNFNELIGFNPIEAYASSYDWIIAVAETEDEIRQATPNFEAMATNGLGHLMITAKSKNSEVDFVVRCFAPSAGINEDPVTGSAHCALTPLWAKKLGKTEMNSLQVSKRTGKLKVKLVNERVEIRGQAITIFKAALNI